jgi:hypothetical protein
LGTIVQSKDLPLVNADAADQHGFIGFYSRWPIASALILDESHETVLHQAKSKRNGYLDE